MVSFFIVSSIYSHFYHSAGISKLQDNLVFIGISLIFVIIYRVILKPYTVKDLQKLVTTTTTTTTITTTPPIETTTNTVTKMEPQTDQG